MPTQKDSNISAGDDGVSNQVPGITAVIPGVVGVDPSDPEGFLPADASVTGLTVIVPKWPNFPEDGSFSSTLVIYFKINGTNVEVFKDSYTGPNSDIEFLIPVLASFLPAAGSFDLLYNVFSPNIDPSPERKLTLTIAVPVVLEEPEFPDATLWRYLNCGKVRPDDPESLFIWEGVRIEVPFDDRFAAGDEIELTWQGWSNLNGTGNALTPPVKFTMPVLASDVSLAKNIKFVVQPFIPYIEPMKDKASARAVYDLIRGGVPIARSVDTGIVKIDRVIPDSNEIIYCDGPAE